MNFCVCFFEAQFVYLGATRGVSKFEHWVVNCVRTKLKSLKIETLLIMGKIYVRWDFLIQFFLMQCFDVGLNWSCCFIGT